MSLKEEAKKSEEVQHLVLFTDAYEEVTGERLTLIAASESPDFICKRANGERVGIEMTRSPHDYGSRMAHGTLSLGGPTTDDYCLLEGVGHILEKKAKLRTSGNWQLPDSTILVISLLDYTFESSSPFQDASLQDDYAGTGFAEIWLADHSTVEAYQSVRLTGLFPADIWGTHRQQSLEQKPFG